MENEEFDTISFEGEEQEERYVLNEYETSEQTVMSIDNFSKYFQYDETNPMILVKKIMGPTKIDNSPDAKFKYILDVPTGVRMRDGKVKTLVLSSEYDWKDIFSGSAVSSIQLINLSRISEVVSIKESTLKGAFSNCFSLETILLPSLYNYVSEDADNEDLLNRGKYLNTEDMFGDCYNLKHIGLNTLSLGTTNDYMFKNCSKVTSIIDIVDDFEDVIYSNEYNKLDEKIGAEWEKWNNDNVSIDVDNKKFSIKSYQDYFNVEFDTVSQTCKVLPIKSMNGSLIVPTSINSNSADYKVTAIDFAELNDNITGFITTENTGDLTIYNISKLTDTDCKILDLSNKNITIATGCVCFANRTDSLTVMLDNSSLTFESGCYLDKNKDAFCSFSNSNIKYIKGLAELDNVSRKTLSGLFSRRVSIDNIENIENLPEEVLVKTRGIISQEFLETKLKDLVNIHDADIVADLMSYTTDNLPEEDKYVNKSIGELKNWYIMEEKDDVVVIKDTISKLTETLKLPDAINGKTILLDIPFDEDEGVFTKIRIKPGTILQPYVLENLLEPAKRIHEPINKLEIEGTVMRLRKDSLKNLFINTKINTNSVSFKNVKFEYLDGTVSLESMFSGNETINEIDLGDLDETKITSLKDTFKNCHSLSLLKAKFLVQEAYNSYALKAPNAKDLSGMMAQAHDINLYNLRIAEVPENVNMMNAFIGCQNITSIDISALESQMNENPSNFDYMLIINNQQSSPNLNTIIVKSAVNFVNNILGKVSLYDTARAVNNTIYDIYDLLQGRIQGKTLTVRSAGANYDFTMNNIQYLDYRTKCAQNIAAQGQNVTQDIYINNCTLMASEDEFSAYFDYDIIETEQYNLIKIKSTKKVSAFLDTGTLIVPGFVYLNSGKVAIAYLPDDCTGLFADGIVNAVPGIDSIDCIDIYTVKRTLKPAYIDLSNLLDTSNITSADSMFYNNNNLIAVIPTTANTIQGFAEGQINQLSNVKNLNNTFHGCENLSYLRAQMFNYSNIETMNGTFEGCKRLASKSEAEKSGTPYYQLELTTAPNNLTEMVDTFKDMSEDADIKFCEDWSNIRPKKATINKILTSGINNISNLASTAEYLDEEGNVPLNVSYSGVKEYYLTVSTYDKPDNSTITLNLNNTDQGKTSKDKSLISFVPYSSTTYMTIKDSTVNVGKSLIALHSGVDVNDSIFRGRRLMLSLSVENLTSLSQDGDWLCKLLRDSEDLFSTPKLKISNIKSPEGILKVKNYNAYKTNTSNSTGMSSSDEPSIDVDLTGITFIPADDVSTELPVKFNIFHDAYLGHNIHIKNIKIRNFTSLNRAFEMMMHPMSTGSQDITIEGFDTTECEEIDDADYMFKGIYCKTLTLKDCNLSNVRHLDDMFSKCKAGIIKLINCNFSGAVSSRYMFNDCSMVSEIHILDCEMSNIKDITGMFSRCKSLDKIVTKGTKITPVYADYLFNTTRLTMFTDPNDYNNEFFDCFNFLNVETAKAMFGCVEDMDRQQSSTRFSAQSERILNLSTLQMPKCKDASRMFEERQCDTIYVDNLFAPEGFVFKSEDGEMNWDANMLDIDSQVEIYNEGALRPIFNKVTTNNFPALFYRNLSGMFKYCDSLTFISNINWCNGKVKLNSKETLITDMFSQIKSMPRRKKKQNNNDDEVRKFMDELSYLRNLQQ